MGTDPSWPRSGAAIDPKGVVGEREYETGTLMRNPIPVLHGTRTPARRADQLAEALGLDGERTSGAAQRTVTGMRWIALLA